MTTLRCRYEHPVLGRLQLHFQNQQLCRLDLPYPHLYQNDATDMPAFWQQQLDGYFTGRLQVFEGDMNIIGSRHDMLVWQAMLLIPYGQTQTYGDMAKQIGSSAQAVGQACKRNPIPIVIPCHRVVAQSHLGGYSGSTGLNTLSIKHWLLEHERTHAL